MRPIPASLKQRLLEEQDMETCCHCGRKADITWEHPWTYAGKQINEIWSVIPACRKCHLGRNGTGTKGFKDSARYESIKRLIASGFENIDKYNKDPLTWPNRIHYYTKFYEKKR